MQFQVCTTQQGGKNFTIRLNYNDIENFTGKVTMQIVTMPKCEFPKRLKELCIDWIKEEVMKNPIYFTNLVRLWFYKWPWKITADNKYEYDYFYRN